MNRMSNGTGWLLFFFLCRIITDLSKKLRYLFTLGSELRVHDGSKVEPKIIGKCLHQADRAARELEFRHNLDWLSTQVRYQIKG